MCFFRLEQVSSDERVGSLAENLMEAIRKNPGVAQKIEEVRKQTKDEKKRLAMAMREKQLGALGMSTNEKGQVKAFKKTFLRFLINILVNFETLIGQKANKWNL